MAEPYNVPSMPIWMKTRLKHKNILLVAGMLKSNPKHRFVFMGVEKIVQHTSYFRVPGRWWRTHTTGCHPGRALLNPGVGGQVYQTVRISIKRGYDILHAG